MANQQSRGGKKRGNRRLAHSEEHRPVRESSASKREDKHIRRDQMTNPDDARRSAAEQ